MAQSNNSNEDNVDNETSPLLLHATDLGLKNVHDSASLWWKEWFPRFNFYRVHLVYFVVTITIGSIIVYGIDQGVEKDMNLKKLSWVDALFFTTSAMTLIGI